MYHCTSFKKPVKYHSYYQYGPPSTYGSAMKWYEPPPITANCVFWPICVYTELLCSMRIEASIWTMYEWLSGRDAGHINNITPRCGCRARLVLRHVTHWKYTASVCATEANSASYPQLDGKWVPAGTTAVAVFCSWEGNRRSRVAPNTSRHL